MTKTVFFHPNDGWEERTILHTRRRFMMYAMRIPAFNKTAATSDMFTFVGCVAQIIRNIQAITLEKANEKHNSNYQSLR